MKRNRLLTKRGTCLWCREPLVNGVLISGGIGVDWMTDNGDFGCGSHPLTNEEGTWSHQTREEVGATVLNEYERCENVLSSSSI